GGKRWLLPHLRTIFARHAQRRLVEPFCGGLAITLGLQPEDALLNDIIGILYMHKNDVILISVII
ncbi:MAG: DNA adenine methylase, partial [Candidatus Vogelbacteria bacterium]|nr:DNA adenine methylase [Candidatus Vogelbacteria bacterium]